MFSIRQNWVARPGIKHIFDRLLSLFRPVCGQNSETNDTYLCAWLHASFFSCVNVTHMVTPTVSSALFSWKRKEFVMSALCS